MKISLSAALENDEIVFARIDCANKRGRVAYSFKRGSSNAELRVLRSFPTNPVR